MDEITLFTAVRPDAPERLGEPERGEVLGRLLAAAASERDAGKQMTAASRLRRARWTWRLRMASSSPAVRRLGIAAAAAAATLATVAAVLFAFPARGHTPVPARTQSTVPAPAAGLGTQDLTARPGQFVYTEQLIEGESYLTGQNGMHPVKVPPYLQRMWMSANGRRGLAGTQRNLPDGRWSRLGGVESLCEGVEGRPGRQVCYPGYLTNLPGTVSGMLSYLLRNGGPNGPAAYRVLDSIATTTSSASGLLVPNASYALMYRAALTVNGVYKVRHATTIAGTPGIAVAACVPAAINKGSMPGFRGCPYRTELIFDARTYQLIGVDHMAAPGRPALPGRPDSALLQIAVVNKIGQIP
jgi:hypothetical protein